MMDKLAAGLIFILLSWWVIDEYIEEVEFQAVMAEHHAHFVELSEWRKEWRGLIDTYLSMWTKEHPNSDCSRGPSD